MATNVKDQTRELEICALYSGGETMQEIADRYGVSRERIRQILDRNGLAGGWGPTRVDPLKIMGLVAECSTIREIAQRIGGSVQQVRRVLRALAPVALAELEAYRHEATRNRRIAHLRALAGRLGRTPTKADLDANGGATPFQWVFGSLTAAHRAAGLKPHRSGHPHLSAAQTEAIRRLYVKGRGRRAPGNANHLAKRFGITPNRVNQIVREKVA